MSRRPPGSPRTDTRLPFSTLCRSASLYGAERGRAAVCSEARASRPVFLLFPERVSRRPALRNSAARPRRGTKATACEGCGFLMLYGVSPMRVGALFNRSEEHTSELHSLMRISYAVFRLKTKKTKHTS